MAMTQTGYGRAARPVEIALATAVDYIAALTSGSGWQNGGGGATKDMTVHGFILKSGDSLTAALQAGD